MAQGGYLHFARASLRCDNSFWSSSGLVETVLALCVSVPMTLYLADKLWWLSHCKYWSVWVGLQYTVNEKELSASGVTKVSRKGIPPFPWEPSTVNLIAGSMLLIYSRKTCLSILCWMTHVSSTNLYQYLGGLEVEWRASLSKCSMYRLATMGLTGDPITTPSTCSKNSFWNEKYVLCRQNPRRPTMCCTDNTVLSCNLSSFSKRSLILFRAGSIGTEVKSAVTLYDVRHSPSWRVIFLALFTKLLVLCIWWGIYPLKVWLFC